MDVSKTVELRVHGVSGTPPEDLLDRPDVVLVAGDRTAGFYRPRFAAESTDSYPVGDPSPQVAGPPLEGYVWGGLTSGAPSRAFWLLLLPFTLINVAPRLRPDDRGDTRTRLLWFLCRLLALSLTIALVAAFVGIGVDLVGWQCGTAGRRCMAAKPGWLFDVVNDRSTAHRMLLGGLLPVVALGLLWLVSYKTFARYEQQPAPMPKPVDGHDPAEAVDVPLSSPWMWRNEHPVRRLRGVHMQVGFAVIVAMAAAPLPGLRWVDLALAVVVVFLAILLLWNRSFVGHEELAWPRKVSAAVWLALLAAYAATAITLGWFADQLPENEPRRCVSDVPLLPGARVRLNCSPDGLPDDGLPHFGTVIVWLLIVQLVLIGVLAVVTGSARRAARSAGRDDGFGTEDISPGLTGRGSVIMALIAVFLGSVFTAGGYLYSAAYLSTGSPVPGWTAMSTLSSRFRITEPMYDAGLAYTIAVVVAAVMTLGFVARVGVVTARIREGSWLLVPGSFEKDYPVLPTATDEPGRKRIAARTASILRARFLGRLVDVAGSVLGPVVVFGGVLTSVFAAVLLAERLPGLHWNRAANWLFDSDGHAAQLARVRSPGLFSRIGLQAVGAYLVVFTLVGLVLLGALAFRAPPTRRSVGILWDLASFWPRLSHPLAAPCYAERTVPDLVERIGYHAAHGRDVVLAAHSQGTVISAATIEQLRTKDALPGATPVLGKVGLLTFGCVLRRLYARYFPAYFGAGTLRDVAAAVRSPGRAPRWWNLWRFTDYLGGPILSGPPPPAATPWNPAVDLPDTGADPLDLHLVDPAFDIPDGDTVYPRPGRHSDFWKVPEFSAAVVGLADRVADDGRSNGVGGPP